MYLPKLSIIPTFYITHTTLLLYVIIFLFLLFNVIFFASYRIHVSSIREKLEIMAHHHLHHRMVRKKTKSRRPTQRIMMKMVEKRKIILTKIPTATIIITTVGVAKHSNQIQKTKIVVREQKKVCILYF